MTGSHGTATLSELISNAPVVPPRSFHARHFAPRPPHLSQDNDPERFCLGTFASARSVFLCFTALASQQMQLFLYCDVASPLPQLSCRFTPPFLHRCLLLFQLGHHWSALTSRMWPGCCVPAILALLGRFNITRLERHHSPNVSCPSKWHKSDMCPECLIKNCLCAQTLQF